MPRSRRNAKRGRGQSTVDGRTVRGRRLKDLVEAFSIDLDMTDEAVAALVRSAAALAVEAEDLGDARESDKGNLLAYVRVTGARDRAIAKLNAMRAEARAKAPAPTPGQGGWTQPLYRHLHWMGWLSDRIRESGAGLDGPGDTWVDHGVPSSRFQAGLKDEKLLGEYARLEARGAFRDAVR
jgi:hypothetical protein